MSKESFVLYKSFYEPIRDLCDAEFAEINLHSNFKEFKYIPKGKFIGYTECFYAEIIKLL